MSSLVDCGGCRRHIRRNEATCPFCGITVTAEVAATPERTLPTGRLGRAALMAMAAAALGTACTSSGSAYGAPAHPPDWTGGTPGVGGATATGGVLNFGGVSNSGNGGVSAVALYGAPAAGFANGDGGGGAKGSGGATASGGTTSDADAGDAGPAGGAAGHDGTGGRIIAPYGAPMPFDPPSKS